MTSPALTSTEVLDRLDSSKLLHLYREMLIIRRTEEQLAKSYQAGMIPGACHTYIGEEAIAVGVCAHLTHQDAVFSTHRGHGHALAKGVPPREVIAELFGRATGWSHALAGTQTKQSAAFQSFTAGAGPASRSTAVASLRSSARRRDAVSS